MIRQGYVALLVLLLAILWSPLLLRPSYLLYPREGQATDLTITHWPAVDYNVRSLHQDGQIPLWRTTIASGGPWIANPQSWLLYPPAWLFFVLPIDPTFNLLLMAHLILAALATYAFGREAVELHPPGAALAGLAYALAPWVSGHLAGGHVNMIFAVAWVPVGLLATDRAIRKGSVPGALLASVAWAAALINHIQMAALALVLTTGWALVLVLGRSAPVKKPGRAALLLLSVAVMALLSATLLIPLAEAQPYLNRTSLSLEEAGVFSLPWTHLLTAVVPTYGGEPEQVIYLGLPVALLALVGFALRRSRMEWFLAITAAGAALFALGTYGPLFPLLHRWIPGLDLLRVPPRAWILVSFCMALAAGRGLDALLPEPDRTTQHRVSLIATGALGLGWALAASLLVLYRPTPPAVWVMATVVALTVAALWLRARARVQPRSFALVVLLLAAADLALVRGAWTEMRAPEEAFAWGSETADYLAEQPGPFRSYSPSYSLPQHTAAERELFLADGVDPMQLAHYARFLAQAGGYEVAGYSPTLPPVLDDISAQPDAVRLGLLNVAYVASSFPIQVDGLVLSRRLGETYLYQNEQTLPRAFVVPYSDLSGRDDLSLVTPIQPTAAPIIEYSPNRIVVEVDLEEQGLLVLSEVWYPGWRVRSDGQEAVLQRVEGTLRGVLLDRGSHTVEFRYQPWTASVGAVLSGGTALLLLGYAGWCFRRKA